MGFELMQSLPTTRIIQQDKGPVSLQAKQPHPPTIVEKTLKFHKIPQMIYFDLILSLSECPGCGVGIKSDEFTCLHPCGYIASPNYPHGYPDNTKIMWYIRIAADNYINLQFTHFLVESSLTDCKQDFLEVYNILRDGSKGLMGRYCQASPPPAVLLSGMNEMTIIFQSDQHNSNSGFFGHYTSEHYTLPQHLITQINQNGMNSIFITNSRAI